MTAVLRRLSCVLVAFLICAGAAEAQTIQWLDWSTYTIGSGSGTIISHPVLGDIEVTTNFEPQATFDKTGGALGGLSWPTFTYINYDASSSGTNAPISAVMTFDFLDGPIDLSKTRVFFSANGLFDTSTYRIDGSPIYLGAIGAADGPGTYTPIGQDLLIMGNGFNHDPDLIEFQLDPLSSVTVIVSQALGDGAGFTIGAAKVPSVPVLSEYGLLGLAGLLLASAAVLVRSPAHR